MAPVLIIDGHPHASSLCASLAQRYAAGVRSAGVEALTIAIRDLNFDPILRVPNHERQALEPDLERIKVAIEQSRRVMLISPVWWGSVPALLKGFLDRAFETGWAFRYQDNGRPEGLLSGRSARIVVTSDSPGFYLRWIQGDTTVKSLARSTFRLCGFHPVDVTRIGPVQSAKREQIAAWLQQMERTGKSDADRIPRP